MQKQATDVEPQLLDRYVMYGELAAGGMAAVHFGRLRAAQGFSRTVAIKCLHPQYAKDPAFRAMFLDEARIASRIQHPNVVTMLDVVQADDGFFLVMDYIAGESLARLLSAARNAGEHVPPSIAAAVLAGTLAGLHAAHEATTETGDDLELVHRDVSPQNILVGRDGVARVVDFGIARAAVRSQVSQEGQLKGKLRYMAPEQLRGENVTRQTDIYAAAVVLWEVLTGQSLFGGSSVAEIFGRILEGVLRPPSALADVPPAVDRLVLRGLSPDPKDRYATALEMAMDLEEAIVPAGPRQVGAWVERVAGDRLSALSRRLAAIEASPVSTEDGSARLSVNGAAKSSVGKRGELRSSADGAGAPTSRREPRPAMESAPDGFTPVSTPLPSSRPASVRWLNPLTVTDAARPAVMRQEEAAPASKTLLSEPPPSAQSSSAPALSVPALRAPSLSAPALSAHPATATPLSASWGTHPATATPLSATSLSVPPPSAPAVNVSSPDTQTALDTPRPVTERAGRPVTTWAHGAERSDAPTPISTALPIRSMQYEVREPPSSRPRSSWWLGGAAALVAGAVLAVLVWRGRAVSPVSDTTTPAAPSAPEVTHVPDPIPPAPPAPPPAAERETPPLTPASSVVLSPAPAPAPAPSAGSPQTARSAKPAGARPAPTRASCNPPFYVDKAGVRRVKRECF